MITRTKELNDVLSNDLSPFVKQRMQSYLATRPVTDLGSLTVLQQVIRAVESSARLAIVEAWKEELVRVCEEIGSSCPGCKRTRRRRWKPPMKLDILGDQIELPKLYLECNHCDAPAVSITRIVTGLRNGDSSEPQKLVSAYCAADNSYGKARRDLGAHYGRKVERTKVRRSALEIEKAAMLFAEESRKKELARIEQEGVIEGAWILILEADGGNVRTGTLQDYQPGDPGYGKKTPKWGIPRRKRPTNYRELLTFDVREPGEVEATALDVMVPVQSGKGERSRRMLALASAQRHGREHRDDRTR